MMLFRVHRVTIRGCQKLSVVLSVTKLFTRAVLKIAFSFLHRHDHHAECVFEWLPWMNNSSNSTVECRHKSPANQWTNNLLSEIKKFPMLELNFSTWTAHVASSHPHLEKVSRCTGACWRNGGKKHLRSLTWHVEMRRENMEKFGELKNYSQDLCVCFLMPPDNRRTVSLTP